MTIADVAPTTGQVVRRDVEPQLGRRHRRLHHLQLDWEEQEWPSSRPVRSGVVSNPIPVFIHPIVTSLVLGSPSTDCTTDPATNCSPAAVNSVTVDQRCLWLPDVDHLSHQPDDRIDRLLHHSSEYRLCGHARLRPIPQQVACRRA